MHKFSSKRLFQLSQHHVVTNYAIGHFLVFCCYLAKVDSHNGNDGPNGKAFLCSGVQIRHLPFKISLNLTDPYFEGLNKRTNDGSQSLQCLRKKTRRLNPYVCPDKLKPIFSSLNGADRRNQNSD